MDKSKKINADDSMNTVGAPNIFIGVEIGSEKTVMSTVANDRLEIILSETVDKITNTVVSYPINPKGDERQVGLSAKNHIKKNQDQTYNYFMRFLGLNFSNKDHAKFIQREKDFINYKIIGDQELYFESK